MRIASHRLQFGQPNYKSKYPTFPQGSWLSPSRGLSSQDGSGDHHSFPEARVMSLAGPLRRLGGRRILLSWKHLGEREWLLSTCVTQDMPRDGPGEGAQPGLKVFPQASRSPVLPCLQRGPVLSQMCRLAASQLTFDLSCSRAPCPLHE